MHTILLADDDENFRRLVCRVLGDHGMQVIEADPDGALAEAERFTGRIDLLCSQAALARVGGVTLAERLKRKHPEMKVLLLVPEKRYFHMTAGLHELNDAHPDYSWMQKPFTLLEFTTRVRQLIGAPQGKAAPG